MKIILSRKGFDSSIGGVASPIFSSGALCSLPIPDRPFRTHGCRYADVRLGDATLGPLVRDLSRGRVAPAHQVHLDPDLRAESLSRAPGWRPVFGQASAAETHLKRMGVGAGDLFLFYGWFRQVKQVDGRYRYVRGAPDLHVLYGWMQIAQRLPLNQPAAIPAWARYHPHCHPFGAFRAEALYIATERLTLGDERIELAGGGVFPQFHAALALTAPGATRSLWRLPRWFHPAARQSALSYHSDPRRWTLRDDSVLLQSAAQGQEFVLDCADYPEAVAWAAGLLRSAIQA